MSRYGLQQPITQFSQQPFQIPVWRILDGTQWELGTSGHMYHTHAI